MNQADALKDRTYRFALRVVTLARQLFPTTDGQVIGRQLVKAGTGVAANYRAACRARSAADFVAKMGIVEEEADETGFWLRLIGDLDLTKDPGRQELQREAHELVAIAAASRKTARARIRCRVARL